MPARILVSLIVFAALSAVSAASAEPPEQRLRDRARTFLVLRLTEALGLSDDEALRVGRTLEESEARRMALEEERRGVETEIREVLRSGPTDDERVAALVDRASKLDEEMALVPARTFRELRSFLSVEQQAKLALARPKIHEEIRDAMRRRLDARRPREADQPGGGPAVPTQSGD